MNREGDRIARKGRYVINRFPLIAHYAKAVAMESGYDEWASETLGAAIATTYAFRKNTAPVLAPKKPGQAGERTRAPRKQTERDYGGTAKVKVASETFDVVEGRVVGWGRSRNWRPVDRGDFEKEAEKLNRLTIRGSDRFTALCIDLLRQRGLPETQQEFFKLWQEMRTSGERRSSGAKA